jgi:branched-chain amino acid transport system permease protein
VELLIAGTISGVAVGALYGLLGFAVVLLYKSTGVANFAQGTLGTLGAFLVYQFLTGLGWNLWASVGLSVVAMTVIGALLYLVILLPRGDADHVNLLLRTLGISLLLLAIINANWATGQPFNFPSVLPGGVAFEVGGASVGWVVLGTLAIAALLATGFRWFFSATKTGLMFLGVADKPEVAQLLGVRTRRLNSIAWALASVVSLIVALLVAPRSLLSSDMMEFYLLFGFTAAIVGGLTSLWGAFVGGAVIGIVNNLVTIYADSDLAVVSIFAVLLVVLLVRPEGLFGDKSMVERL